MKLFIPFGIALVGIVLGFYIGHFLPAMLSAMGLAIAAIVAWLIISTSREVRALAIEIPTAFKKAWPDNPWVTPVDIINLVQNHQVRDQDSQVKLPAADRNPIPSIAGTLQAIERLAKTGKLERKAYGFPTKQRFRYRLAEEAGANLARQR